MGISWTQRHRWTLTGWWHSLDGTVMSDDTHWVMILMGDEYHLWWLTLGESNRLLAKDTDCCHSMNNANTHGWWPSLGDDTHWVMTTMDDKDHWSLIIDPHRVKTITGGDDLSWYLSWWSTHTNNCHWVMTLPLGGKSLGDAYQGVMDDRCLTFTGWRLSWWWRSLMISIGCFLSWLVTIVFDDYHLLMATIMADDYHLMTRITWWGWVSTDEDEDHLMRVIVSFTGWWYSPSDDHHRLTAISDSYHPLIEIIDWWLPLNNNYHGRWVSWLVSSTFW